MIIEDMLIKEKNQTETIFWSQKTTVGTNPLDWCVPSILSPRYLNQTEASKHIWECYPYLFVNKLWKVLKVN